MAKEGPREELPEKVWLPWVQEGPYLVRHQHLVARDEGEPSLCPVPIGRQVRGLAKATLEELRAGIRENLVDLVRQMAERLAQGRPYRLILREMQAHGRDPREVEEALMALCRAGLVVVFFRNRWRCQVQWEPRHAELTNWGKALLISIEAVSLPAPRAAQRVAPNGAVKAGSARRPAQPPSVSTPRPPPGSPPPGNGRT